MISAVMMNRYGTMIDLYHVLLSCSMLFYIYQEDEAIASYETSSNSNHINR
ncbi:hypothetical protein [Guptibacillus algicola]|uniref:hypothetical protein n=1 Tax=Guptibacillus algicola TaxID=225844 RepID=UPI001CD5BA4C|nr:hypothetical protein [Alkalihalobacillus algicola]MCA0987445.1 hypothetical protein [Alkalihalobacillus algicola]